MGWRQKSKNSLFEFSPGQKGFTLVEVFMAVAIMALVITGAVSIYMMSHTAWREGSTQIALQRDASLAMEKMVRGTSGRYGIREGSEISSPPTGVTSDRIEVIVDMNDPPTPWDSLDDTTISFYKSDDQLIYDPDTSNVGDEISMAKKVATLNFEHLSAKRVKVDLTLRSMVIDKPIEVSLTTEVTLRN